MKQPVVMSWSGGKDSAVALDALMTAGQYDVVALLTSVSEEYRRISHHGVREALLDQQAASIGLPLEKVFLPSRPNQPCTNDVYERIMGEVMARYRAQGVEIVAFGDLFLEDLRAYRERQLAKADMRGLFPLWNRNTTELAADVIARGFQAYLSCVEGHVGPGFVGRAFDTRLLAALPQGVDPCGEYGEFHTFVHDGPIFKRPVAVEVGEVVMRDGRYYADLRLRGMGAPAPPVSAWIPPV
ncbi:MAG: ATP-binding protein [Acidobacteriota bacterium]